MHTKGPSALKLSQKSTDDKHTIRLVVQQSARILLKIRAPFCCVNDRPAKSFTTAVSHTEETDLSGVDHSRAIDG